MANLLTLPSEIRWRIYEYVFADVKIRANGKLKIPGKSSTHALKKPRDKFWLFDASEKSHIDPCAFEACMTSATFMIDGYCDLKRLQRNLNAHTAAKLHNIWANGWKLRNGIYETLLDISRAFTNLRKFTYSAIYCWCFEDFPFVYALEDLATDHQLRMEEPYCTHGSLILYNHIFGDLEGNFSPLIPLLQADTLEIEVTRVTLHFAKHISFAPFSSRDWILYVHGNAIQQLEPWNVTPAMLARNYGRVPIQQHQQP